VTGTLDASSRSRRGRKIRLGRKSLVKASCGTRDGDIRIGGDRDGKGPGRNADSVVLAPKARIIDRGQADGTGRSSRQ